MKTSIRLALAASSLVLSLTANAYSIDDAYVGSNSHGYGDVIGEHSLFDIQGMDVSVSGSMLNVSVYTNFAKSNGGLGTYAAYTSNGKGIGLGDLFLSSLWTPAGSANEGYLGDTAATGTQWQYGLALNNRWGTSGTATLYALNGDGNSDIKTSNTFITNAIYRDGQAVAVKKNADGVIAGLNGQWSLDQAAGTVNFAIDLAFTGLLQNDQLALRWEETCANDAIEGQVVLAHEVPEPGTLALLTLGALGLIRRRQRA